MSSQQQETAQVEEPVCAFCDKIKTERKHYHGDDTAWCPYCNAYWFRFAGFDEWNRTDRMTHWKRIYRLNAENPSEEGLLAFAKRHEEAGLQWAKENPQKPRSQAPECRQSSSPPGMRDREALGW